MPAKTKQLLFMHLAQAYVGLTLIPWTFRSARTLNLDCGTGVLCVHLAKTNSCSPVILVCGTLKLRQFELDLGIDLDLEYSPTRSHRNPVKPVGH